MSGWIIHSVDIEKGINFQFFGQITIKARKPNVASSGVEWKTVQFKLVKLPDATNTFVLHMLMIMRREKHRPARNITMDCCISTTTLVADSSAVKWSSVRACDQWQNTGAKNLPVWPGANFLSRHRCQYFFALYWTMTCWAR